LRLLLRGLVLGDDDDAAVAAAHVEEAPVRAGADRQDGVVVRG